METTPHEPQSYKEACAYLRWRVAMKQKYDLIIKNGTWEFKDLSFRKNIVSNKWVFKKKLAIDGTIKKLKEQLVARGFEQAQGIEL